MSKPIDLLETLSLFRQYIHLLNEHNAPRNDHELAAEARKRLRQLHMLLDLIYRTQRANKTYTDSLDQYEDLNGPEGKSTFIKIFGSMENLELFTECFYLLAWRLRGVLRSLPLLGSFDCIGVRNVRNRLIEHPDPRDQPLLPAFSLDDEKGPILKPFIGPDGKILDDGLWENAKEFKKNVNRLLKLAISNDSS